MHLLGTQLPALRNRLSAMRRSVVGVFPLGIAARMTIALGSVAILAIAANIVGETTVLFIRTHTTEAREAPRPVNRIAPRPPRPETPAPAIDARRSALALAIDRFEHASAMRAERESAVDDGEYIEARASLLKFDAVQFNGMFADKAGAARIARSVQSFVGHGQLLVALSDERRQARAGYLRSLDALNTAMQRALDGAWTFLGRVVARQSLQLRAELDAIRQNSEILRLEDLPNTSGIDRLKASEAAFQTTLTAHQASLVKSQGARWAQDIQDNLTSLVVLRKQQVLLGAQQDESNRSLAKERAALSAAASAAFVAADLVNLKNTASAAPLSPITRGAESPVALDTPVTDSIVTTETGTGRDARPTMAIVTILTLLVTTVVCILTVRSVVVPVRRFLEATTKLARGNHDVHVTPGGIRELDTLADAFNEMAQQLAEERTRNRHQNENLEAKVVERTRQLQRLAEEDPLTSLPNRRRLQALLSDAIDNATRNNRCVGVYFVDIDHFKNFNDTLGHAFGDRVLMSVANRLEELVDGRGFVARLGGDEFTVVYGDAPSAEAIRDLGLSIVSAFQPLLLVDDREFSVSVSVGASMFPEHDTAAEGLLRAADSALFGAKESGRSRLVVFTSELIETAAVRFATEQGLRRAIDRQELLLMYQPEVSLKTFEIGLVEALLRWQRPDGHLAHPGEFLPIAEQSSLASEINEWVLRAAVSDASRWHHGGWPEVRVAINVSPRQLLDRRFTERLLLLLDEYRLPARCIELELTETVLQTGQLTIDTLRVLRSHGIGIALDDFGTGYSSITSLQDLPLSRVKLDRSLIATIDTSERASVITRAIIELCHGLGLEVTAEGIERPEQLAWLSNQSAMFLQGYLLSRALPFAELLDLRAIMPQRMQDFVLSQSPKSSPVPHEVSLLRGRSGTFR
jgi:diguanylate cyclase (GGDEF)-like protein